MLGIESLSGNALAVATVGVVLAEAMVLYVGYGALSRVAGPQLLDAVSGE
ncbi:DUF7512 family protein [Halomicrococcus sp. NG-SE-24]